DRALTKLLMQRSQRGTPLREDETAGRLAIQPVHQRQVLQVRPGKTQQFDDAVTDAAAAVHRRAARLVDHQQAPVLEQHPLGDTRPICASWIGTRLARPCRRNPLLLTRLEALACPNPAAANTYLPAPQQPV